VSWSLRKSQRSLDLLSLIPTPIPLSSCRGSLSSNQSSMFAEEERLKSFNPTTTSDSKSSRKTTTTSSCWPHPSTFPSPSDLASAGFYFSPTSTSKDRCQHFLNDTLTHQDWSKTDEPFPILSSIDPNNPWLLIHKSSAFAKKTQPIQRPIEIETKKVKGKKSTKVEFREVYLFQQQQLLPHGDQMVQARKLSFGKNWPYDGKKGWKCTSDAVSLIV